MERKKEKQKLFLNVLIPKTTGTVVKQTSGSKIAEMHFLPQMPSK